MAQSIHGCPTQTLNSILQEFDSSHDQAVIGDLQNPGAVLQTFNRTPLKFWMVNLMRGPQQ